MRAHVDALAHGSAGEASSDSGDDRRTLGAWRFTGGTIKRVAVDVGGEPYVDLEREDGASCTMTTSVSSRTRPGAEQALKPAAAESWTVVSMQRDWASVF